jgi:CPA1 family monovalent cation:H+ antiporter
MVFLITGLQARRLMSSIAAYSISDLVVAAIVVSAVVIATRFVWMYPATYLPRWLVPAIRRVDPSPPWQWPFVLAFTGVRGIVSLTAALAIPFTIADGSPFPDRDMILFLTFCVIVVTLVGEGLTLPFVTRALGLANAGRRERQDERSEEFKVRRRAIEAGMERLDALAADRKLPESVAAPMRALYRDRLRHVDYRNDGDPRHKKLVEFGDELEYSLIEAERSLIDSLYRNGELKEDARRRIEYELDLRDARLANLRAVE